MGLIAGATALTGLSSVASTGEFDGVTVNILTRPGYVIAGRLAERGVEFEEATGGNIVVTDVPFAEIFLRIGGGIGGWIIFFAHALIIAALQQADCDPRDDEMWKGTLLLAILSGGGALTMGLGLPWRASLRWFALGTVPLAVYAVLGVLPEVASTTLGGGSLCAIASGLPEGIDLASFPATTLQRIWPVAQIAVLSGGSLQALRYWRDPHDTDPPLASAPG